MAAPEQSPSTGTKARNTTTITNVAQATGNNNTFKRPPQAIATVSKGEPQANHIQMQWTRKHTLTRPEPQPNATQLQSTWDNATRATNLEENEEQTPQHLYMRECKSLISIVVLVLNLIHVK